MAYSLSGSPHSLLHSPHRWACAGVQSIKVLELKPEDFQTREAVDNIEALDYRLCGKSWKSCYSLTTPLVTESVRGHKIESARLACSGASVGLCRCAARRNSEDCRWWGIHALAMYSAITCLLIGGGGGGRAYWKGELLIAGFIFVLLAPGSSFPCILQFLVQLQFYFLSLASLRI